MDYSTQKNKFTFKTVVVLITACLLLFIFIPLTKVQAAAVCPFNYQSGRTIVNFYNTWLISNGTQAQATSNPVNVNLSKGRYDITLSSYDCHSCHPDQIQLNESWYLILKNSQGNTIVNTPAIKDLPSNKDIITEKVASNFSISQNISSIIAFHAAYPSGIINSITPLCVAFDKISEPKPSLTITKSVDKTSANPGDEIVYTLNYKNTGGTASNVVIKDPFTNLNQQYLTFVSSNPDPSSGTYTWNIGTLNKNQSGQITIKAKISNNVPYGTTEIKNRANIDSNETYLQYSNYVSTIVSRQRPPSYSLTITKLVDKTSANPGDEIVYTLNYKNTGQGRATGIIVKDPFNNFNQQYLTFVSSTPAPDFNNDNWYIGSLDPGQSGKITIKAKINSVVPSGRLEIRNRANIDSNQTNLKYSNYVSVFLSSSTRLSIDKLVRNVSKNTTFSSLVTAEPKNEVEFSLKVESTGNSQAMNVKVWDRLPSQLTYISNSTTIDGSSHGDGIINGGINIGNLTSGESKTIKFKAKIASENVFYLRISTLTNYGYTKADNYYTVFDTAAIKVEKESSSSINIEKLVRNVTKKSYNWTDIVYATPDDELEFLIKVNAVGTATIKDIRIKDELPSRITYISGSTILDNSYHPDGITGYGIYIGDIKPWPAKQIKLKVKVGSISEFRYDITTLINWAHAIKPSAEKISDSAHIKVERKETAKHEISIRKSGRNISQNQKSFSNSFSAKPSEEVEFSIQVTNIGNTNLTNVKVWDKLPNQLTYISNSTTIDGSSHGNGITIGGIYLGTLDSKKSKTIKFKAKVSSLEGAKVEPVTLTDTAYASADKVSQVSDQASVIVSITGQVLGATFIAVGANFISLFVLEIISLFIAFLIYCRLREKRILELLNDKKANEILKFLIKFYFKLKSLFPTPVKKKTYWEIDW